MNLEDKVNLVEAKEALAQIKAKQIALAEKRAKLETQIRLAEEYGLYIGGRYYSSMISDEPFQLVSVTLSKVDFVGLDSVRTEEYIQSVTVREIDRLGRLRSEETKMVGYPAKDAKLIFDEI